MWRISEVGGQLGFERTLHYPLGQLSQQPMLTENILRIGIIFQQFIQEGVLFLIDTGHLCLLSLAVRE